MATTEPTHEHREGGRRFSELMTKIQELRVAPIVRLEEVANNWKAKLYRFDKDGNQWKERGAGTVKLLKHKETGKVRLVMRQSKTLKICANHLVLPTMTVQEHAGNEKS
ncbi:Ran-binding protein 1 c [Datura stramonium]|uniref:Ran-binding protein 1 c n=1 Tax=Datura stramonium TaxID=4076 RepID=A0ABS8TDU1_DATST|nr:Ran-binding protein 1 c [Datura stramonium]